MLKKYYGFRMLAEIIKEIENIIDLNSVYEPNTGCLLWTGNTTKYGYGYFNNRGKTYAAHRISKMISIENMNIPSNLCACHRCDTPSCVNPDHIWFDTIENNLKDRDSKGRNPWSSRSSCSRGHKYEEKTYKKYGNKRICLLCQKENSMRLRLLKKQHSELT